jgi:hypothetical protein
MSLISVVQMVNQFTRINITINQLFRWFCFVSFRFEMEHLNLGLARSDS